MECVVCGADAKDWRSGPLCCECEGRLKPLGPPFCVRCGFPIASSQTQCGACLTDKTRFDLGRSALTFDTVVREVIHHFKYNGRVSLARPLGRALAECLNRESFEAECVVPVPLHRIRQRQRGYNQAALLAARLNRRLRLDLIRRRKNTESQTGMTGRQRIGNVHGAFECPRAIKGSILVVDDVQTTGATINEVARVLKSAGATRVEAITVARVADGISAGSEVRDDQVKLEASGSELLTDRS